MVSFAGLRPLVVIHYLCQGGGGASRGALHPVVGGAERVVGRVLVPLRFSKRCNGIVYRQGPFELVSAVCGVAAGGVFELALIFAQPPAHGFGHVVGAESALVRVAQHLGCGAVVGGHYDEAVFLAPVEGVVSF